VKASQEPNSAVICPTLLAQECRFCHQSGHTPIYCTELAKKKKADEKSLKLKVLQQKKEEQKQEQAKKVSKKSSSSKNAFADAFGSDSEDEEEEKETNIKIKTNTNTNIKINTNNKIDEFPALPSKNSITNSTFKTSQPTRASFAEAIKTIHPGLVATQQETYMKEEKYVNAITSNNKIVLNKKQIEEQERKQVEKHKQEYEYAIAESDETYADSIREAAAQSYTNIKFTLKASDLDWSATYDSDDDDSDDEDW
jgi:hypothetical protein